MTEILNETYLVIKCRKCQKHVKYEDSDLQHRGCQTFIKCPNCNENIITWKPEWYEPSNEIVWHSRLGDCYSC